MEADDLCLISGKKELKEGAKFDNGKLEHHLLSKDAIDGLIKILMFGKQKYDAWNWSKGIKYSRVYDALNRHMTAWFAGEEVDPETGLSHVYHAMCNAMFLAHYISNPEKYKEFDDRPKGVYTKEEK